jgi:hypothetical protein
VSESLPLAELALLVSLVLPVTVPLFLTLLAVVPPVCAVLAAPLLPLLAPLVAALDVAAPVLWPVDASPPDDVEVVLLEQWTRSIPARTAAGERQASVVRFMRRE